MKITYESIFI